MTSSLDRRALRGCSSRIYKMGDDTIHFVYADDIESLLDISQAMAQAGDFEGALSAANRAVRMDPTQPVSHCNLGHVNMLLGRQNEALRAYNRAIELEPNHPVGHIVLGDCLMAMKRFQEAFESYNTAASLPKQYGTAYLGQAHALYRMGHTDEGLATAKKAKAMAESCYITSWKLSLFFSLIVGDFAEASRWAENCFRLDPDDSRAYSAMAECCYSRGDLAEAEEWARKANEMERI